MAICEDLWRDGGPVEWAREAQASLFAVLNASPYERMKDDERLQLCVERAHDSGAAIAYTNMTGGQDELVFDGDSLVVDAMVGWWSEPANSERICSSWTYWSRPVTEAVAILHLSADRVRR